MVCCKRMCCVGVFKCVCVLFMFYRVIVYGFVRILFVYVGVCLSICVCDLLVVYCVMLYGLIFVCMLCVCWRVRVF